MDIVTQVILPLILVFIMFSMGLALTVEDFKRVAKFPKAFFLGSFLQIVSLPFLAMLIAHFAFKAELIDATMAVGIVIISVCPGGVTSNLMTHLGKGETALSISLTAIIGIISVFTIPFIVNFSFDHFFGSSLETPLPVGKTIIGIFCISTVPVILGMLLKSKKEKMADKLEPLARRVATIFFVLIVIASIAKKWSLMSVAFSTVGPLIVALNVATMVFAMLVAKAAQLSKPQNVAIVFECGLQNATLAILIAATFLQNEAMIIPAGIYSLAMFFTGGLYLLHLRRTTNSCKNSEIHL